MLLKKRVTFPPPCVSHSNMQTKSRSNLCLFIQFSKRKTTTANLLHKVGSEGSGGVCLYSWEWCNTRLSFISHTPAAAAKPFVVLLMARCCLGSKNSFRDIISQENMPGVCTHELMSQSQPAARQAEQESASVSTSLHFTAVNLQGNERKR